MVVLVCTHHTYTQAKSASAARTRLAHQSSVSPEQEVLRDSAGLSFDNFPSWVAFPDCDRAEWLNVVLKKVWPHLGPVSNTIAKRIIEPKISSVLKSLNVRSLDLEMLSNFKLREFVLGAEAARVGGVKARAANEPSAKFSTIAEKAPTRVSSWLKSPSSAFTFKTSP